MNAIFTILFTISLLCIPVFIIMGLVGIIRKRKAKKHFKLAGISVLVLIASLVGFGFTMDDAATDRAVSEEESSGTDLLAESTQVEPSPSPIASAMPSPTPQPSPTPSARPATTSTPKPTATPTPTVAPTPEASANIASEEPLDFDVMFSDTYRNDVTGKWRLARIAENISIEEYALDYYNSYFESDDEVHIIINFTLNTTTRINVFGNILDVSIMEYVDKEEHDAKIACSGMLLNEYHVNIDNGEIEKIQ